MFLLKANIIFVQNYIILCIEPGGGGGGGGGGHSGRVVTLLPPPSEAGVRFLAWPQVGTLLLACRWSVVYSTEP